MVFTLVLFVLVGCDAAVGRGQGGQAFISWPCHWYSHTHTLQGSLCGSVCRRLVCVQQIVAPATGVHSETSTVASIHAVGDVLHARPELTPVCAL